MLTTDLYHCSGSMDPWIVGEAFNHLFPVWRRIDNDESTRLDEARNALGLSVSTAANLDKVQALWPSAPVFNRFRLPLKDLSHGNFLPFLRGVENLVLEERVSSIIVYWSKYNAARLAPNGKIFRELLRTSLCVSVFFEDRPDPPDEWGFLLESKSLALVVYGQQIGSE